MVKIQALTQKGNIELIFNDMTSLNTWLNHKDTATVITDIIKEEN